MQLQNAAKFPLAGFQLTHRNLQFAIHLRELINSKKKLNKIVIQKIRRKKKTLEKELLRT